MDDSHFFSIDRLIEFGMGMAIAQQMVGSMNNAFQNMATPGVDTMHQGTAGINDQFYYAMIKDKQVGPLSLKDLLLSEENQKKQLLLKSLKNF